MLVYLPIPHDQDEGLAGPRALVWKGEGDKVGDAMKWPRREGQSRSIPKRVGFELELG
jgi:hypothetical protein